MKAGKARKILFNPTEHEEQIALVRWWRAAFPHKPRLLFAIPNGGARNAITGARLKAEGVQAGVPDLFLAQASKGWHGLFIELKRRHGGQTSGAQKAMLGMLERQGYAAKVCHGFEEARDTILSYLDLDKKSLPEVCRKSEVWLNWGD